MYIGTLPVWFISAITPAQYLHALFNIQLHNQELYKIKSIIVLDVPRTAPEKISQLNY